ncbi:hypothetical protein D3C78_1756620 [compost metagenome]
MSHPAGQPEFYCLLGIQMDGIVIAGSCGISDKHLPGYRAEAGIDQYGSRNERALLIP